MSRLSPVSKTRLLLAPLLLGALWLLFSGPSLGSNWARAQDFVSANPDAKVPWELDANIGIQLAASINIVLLALLLITCGWWLRPFTAAPRRRETPAPRASLSRLPRSLLWGLALIVLLGTAARLPLASRSLWWDELWSIRQCSHGSWKLEKGATEDDPDFWKFSPTSWKRCAFYYQKPTNHVPMSLLQKAGLDLWRGATGTPRHAFDDLAARLPTLGLSALSLVLIGCLLRAWGAPVSACLLGTALLALHPMAIRYGVEARGYALVIPLVLSGLLAATRLLRRAGRDGWGWAWLGLNQCLWLWAFPHGLLDVLVMTLLLVLLLMLAQVNARDRFTVCLRLGFAHVLAGMTFLQLFLPNVVQARRWAGQENQGHVLDATILKNTLSQLATGLRWREPGLGTDMAVGLRDLSSLLLDPRVGATLLILLGIWLLWGIIKTLRQGRRAAWLVAGLLLSGAGFALLTWKLELYYYPRFAIALMPVILLGLALGWEKLSSPVGKAQTALLAVLAIVMTAGTWVLLTRPIEPIRDVADWLTAEEAEKGSVLAYGHGREAVLVLKPEAKPVESDTQILAAIDQARAANRPLHLVIGHINFNRARIPTGFPVFEDPARFTEVARFDGIEAELHYRIYRLRDSEQ